VVSLASMPMATGLHLIRISSFKFQNAY
jgi:hypothetical protein